MSLLLRLVCVCRMTIASQSEYVNDDHGSIQFQDCNGKESCFTNNQLLKSKLCNNWLKKNSYKRMIRSNAIKSTRSASHKNKPICFTYMQNKNQGRVKTSLKTRKDDGFHKNNGKHYFDISNSCLAQILLRNESQQKVKKLNKSDTINTKTNNVTSENSDTYFLEPARTPGSNLPGLINHDSRPLSGKETVETSLNREAYNNFYSDLSITYINKKTKTSNEASTNTSEYDTRTNEKKIDNMEITDSTSNNSILKYLLQNDTQAGLSENATMNYYRSIMNNAILKDNKWLISVLSTLRLYDFYTSKQNITTKIADLIATDGAAINPQEISEPSFFLQPYQNKYILLDITSNLAPVETASLQSLVAEDIILDFSISPYQLYIDGITALCFDLDEVTKLLMQKKSIYPITYYIPEFFHYLQYKIKHLGDLRDYDETLEESLSIEAEIIYSFVQSDYFKNDNTCDLFKSLNGSDNLVLKFRKGINQYLRAFHNTRLCHMLYEISLNHHLQISPTMSIINGDHYVLYTLCFISDCSVLQQCAEAFCNHRQGKCYLKVDLKRFVVRLFGNEVVYQNILLIMEENYRKNESEIYNNLTVFRLIIPFKRCVVIMKIPLQISTKPSVAVMLRKNLFDFYRNQSFIFRPKEETLICASK